MFKTLFRASLLLAPAVTAIAATPSADLDELHQRQFRYARAMMQLNQIEGFERGPSIDALLRQEREAKAKRAEERWRDSADVRAQSMDEFAKAVERVASEQRAKRTMSRQWQIDEPYPSHWSVSGNEAAAADCARAIEHPLGQPLRIEMSRDGVAWLRVVAPGKGYWAFDTLVSEFDTKLSVYRDCRDIGAESKQISDDTVGLGSIVGLDAKTAGQTFLIKLERKGGVGSLAIAKSVLAGSISGRVRAAETGAGIRYAVVSFFRSDGANQASLTTNEEGVYSATLYEPGNYYLRARGPDSPYGTTGTEAGYSAGAYPSASCASISDFSIEFCSGEVSAISVLDDSNISDIDLSLHRGGSISGVISAELGGAIPNASIFAILAEDAGEQVTRRMATSDAGGRYRLDDLPPGGWRVEFAHPEHQSERWNDVACTGGLPNACAAGAGNPIETSVDSSFRADAALRADAYIRFRITREGEAAYQGGAFVYDASGQEVGYEYCYQTPCVVSVGPLTPGYYRAKLGASDSYYLVYGGANCIRYCDNSELLAGQLIEVTAQNKVHDVDLDALPRLHGSVLGSANGMPISNALVRLYGLTYSSFASVQTGAGGVFQFSGVRPGTYHLHVSSTGFIDESFNNIRCESQNPVQDCVGAHGITFSFGSPEQTDVIFELDQAAQLAGRATIRAGYSWSNDLRLHRLASDATILSTHSTYMNSDGSYTLREVAAGSFFWGASKPYFFSQIFPGVTCSLESYSGCSTTLAASIVTNEGSIISGVDFDLPGWRSHMVKVVDADSGVPLENVWIDQWDVNGNWLRATRTDALGLTIMQAYESTPLSYERYVTTFAAPEYQNQVYDGVVCPDGTSVYTGGCGLAGGEVVPLVLGGAYPPPIVFALHPTGSIFASGFE